MGAGKSFPHWYKRSIILSTSDPDIVREVLVSKFHDFPKTFLHLEYFRSVFGAKGLLIVNGDEWAQQRKLIPLAFHSEKLKAMTDLMLISINIVINKWALLVNDGGGTAEINAAPDLGLVAGDVISRTSFGITYEKGKRYFELMVELITFLLAGFNVNSLLNEIPGIGLLPTAHKRKVSKLEREMASIVEDVVIQTRLSLASSGESFGADLLGLLLEASKDEEAKYRITNNELMDDLKVFFLAGQESTSTMLCWTMMLLGTNLDWQEKAFEEVERVFGADEALTFDSIGKLKVMDMILNEVRRLYPPAIRMRRTSTRDVHVKDLLIPKGMDIHLNIAALHHDPELWGPDVNAFNPERFANGPARAAKHPSAFIPFSIGPRFCVGQGFAILEAKLLLVSIKI